MGLLDFNNPQVMQGLMLMQGRKGQLPGLLQTIMQMQDAQKQRALQEQSAKQQQEMRDMQIAQMRQQQEQQQQIRSLGAKAFAPNQNLVAGDDEGNAMPSSGGGGMPEFARGLMGVDPMLGAQFMPKPRGPVVLTEGARLISDDGREIAHNPKRVGPEVGKTREIYKGSTLVQQEWDGTKWSDVGSGPRFKPDEPDKPARPQLYDGPEGPVWITPPNAGGGAAPVMGPDGQPIPAKRRNTPLTEAQSRGTLFLGQMREAENAIKGLKFKPETLTGQAQLAAALKAKEAGTVSGAMMNLAAGKDAQQYAQAAEQWAEAFLRIKTGAASTRDEVLRNVRTFFPQPGDTPAVIKQKNAARTTATKQMEIIAGQGVGQLDAQKPGGASVVDWNDLP